MCLIAEKKISTHGYDDDDDHGHGADDLEKPFDFWCANLKSIRN